ncbi:RES family NAD+ phosphorylase [Motilibacter aurantiacus]|uniref:RES family NAD+ phosphorylase n=1 Tax=Motilibacter aurantiacus TaxID=2714955 RepID=UPI001408A84C|nr:RES family NAD+ phosphorylase [Motilibacter aurantiacus]NHC44481.1 RES family NAD+ phosphorylase [Motilibacter aurantiacus]
MQRPRSPEPPLEPPSEPPAGPPGSGPAGFPAPGREGSFDGFPAVDAARATGPFFRIWRARDPESGERRTPWFFSSLPSRLPGRFDLPRPEGTCYFADRAYAAWLEVFRGCGLVDRVDVESRRLLTVTRTAPAPPRLADLRAPASRPFGVTADLVGGDDYALAHRWAGGLRRAGFDGISGTIRHDPTHAARNVALFGPAGPRHRVGGWQGSSTPLARSIRLLTELAPFGTGVAARPWDVAVTPVERPG